MAFDMNAVRSILRLNGLPPGSPDEEIRKVLAGAHYSMEEIESALIILKQPAAAAPAAAEAPAQAVHAPSPFVPPAPASVASPFPPSTPYLQKPAEPALVSPRPGLLGRIVAPLLLLSILGLLWLYGAKIYASAMFFVNGYKPEMLQSLVMSMMPYAGGAAAVMLLFMFLSWRIARGLYRTQSLFIWLLLFTSIYVLLWTVLFLIGAPYALSNVKIDGDPDGLGRAILFGIGITLVNMFFYATLPIGIILGLFRWKSKKVRGKGITAAVITALLAIGVLTYVTGALAYPAKAFKLDALCYGIQSKLERTTCLASSFVPDKDAAFERFQLASDYPHGFAEVGGKFVFITNEKNAQGQTIGNGVYVDGVLQKGTGSVFDAGFDAGGGRVGYIVQEGTRDKPHATYYIEGEPQFSADYIGLVQDDGLTFLVRDGDRVYIKRGDAVLKEGKDAANAYADEKRKAAYAARESAGTGVAIARSADNTEMTYTIGDLVITQKREGLFANGAPLAPGFSTWGVSLVNGKAVMGAFGLNAEKKIETYIILQKGAVSDAVKAKLELLKP